MKKLNKILKHLFCLIFVLLIFILGFLYYALNTESGYKNSLDLITKFTPIKINYQSLEGKFLGKQKIKNLNLKIGEEELLTADFFELNFNFSQLWSDKKISIDNLELKNTVLNLPKSEDKKEEKKKSKPLKQLPQINLPVVLEIKKIAVDNFVIPELDFTINNFYSDAKLEHSLANFNANIDLVIGKNKKINGDLKAKADLKNDYPLELLANSKINLEKDNLNIGLALLGSALKPELKIIASGLVNGEITAIGDISLEKQFLNLASEIKNLKYQDYLLDNLSLSLNGKFNELYLNLNSQFGDNKVIPKSNLESSLLITPDSLKGISLNLKTLGGEIKTFANLNFSPLSWEAEVKVFNILGKNYPQIKEIKDLKLNGEIISSGEIAENIKVNAEVKNLLAKYQDLELKANGNLNLENTKISAQDFNFNLAENIIKINGSLDKNSKIIVDIKAPKLSKLSKVLGLVIKGEVLGNITAEGNYLNPNLSGNLNWKNFAFKDLVNSQKGSLNFNGDLESLKTELKASLAGQGIPPLNADISADLAPLKGVENLRVNLNILEGKLNVAGNASWDKAIAWDLGLKTEGINPQFFSDALKGKINSSLKSVGKLENNILKINNELKELSGSFMGHKLGGAGKVNILDKKIEIPSLSLALGDNRISADGVLNNDNLNFKAKLNLPSLSALYPAIYGNLSGDLAVNGKIKNPELKADLNLGAFRFMDNEIRSGRIKINTGLNVNSSFSNRIELNGISAAGLKWQSIVLNTEGSLQSHRLNLKTQGGLYDISDLSLSGGVSKNLDAWKGSLNALAVEIEGIKLRTRTTAQIEASAKSQSLRNFCITDAAVSSDICLNFSHSDKTNLDFNIAKLTPKTFAKFIPKEIRLNNQISGRGNLVIAGNKNLSGSANLTISAGKIVINTGSSAPIVLNLQRGGLAANFKGSTVNAKALIDLGKSGNLNAEVNLGNIFANPTINGKASLAIADIGAYKYLAPQLSVLQGSLRGQVAIGGALNKPTIGGDILLSNGRVVVPQFSTDLNNIRLAVQSGKDGNFHIDGNIGTPEGALKANGVLKLSPLILDLKLSGKRMLIANSKEMKVYISPDFEITITPKDGLSVRGQILIPEAKISIPDVKGSVSASEDVVIKSKKKKYAHLNTKPKVENGKESEANMPTKIRIAIILGDRVFFKNADMSIRLLGKLNIGLRNGNLRGFGRVEVAEGTYEVYGQELIIQRGSATFSGDITNPALDILALRDIGDIKAGAKISGTVRNMKLELTSEPLMSDASILSYLLTGRAPDSSSDSTALLQTAVAMGTRSIISSDLADKTGLDVFDVNIAGLKAGKYLGENIYVGMKSDFFKAVTTFLARYKISKRLSIEASSSTEDGNAVDLLYEWESKK